MTENICDFLWPDSSCHLSSEHFQSPNKLPVLCLASFVRANNPGDGKRFIRILVKVILKPGSEQMHSTCVIATWPVFLYSGEARSSWESDDNTSSSIREVGQGKTSSMLGNFSGHTPRVTRNLCVVLLWPVLQKCDHAQIYKEISDENLELMRERLMDTVIWPSDDTNSEKIGWDIEAPVFECIPFVLSY